jgi:multicomponent Na+:H+ antiporter subunit E
MRLFLPGALLGLWLLAWGDVSVANVASGIVLIGVLMLAFPARRGIGARVRVHPIGLVRLAAYVLAQLAVSNVLVAREIVSRRSRVRTGVVAYRVQQPSALTLTLMANILALSPGTMPVDVTQDPPILAVHFLLLSDVDAARKMMARLETLIVAALEAHPDASTRGTPDGIEP